MKQFLEKEIDLGDGHTLSLVLESAVHSGDIEFGKKVRVTLQVDSMVTSIIDLHYDQIRQISDFFQHAALDMFDLKFTE